MLYSEAKAQEKAARLLALQEAQGQCEQLRHITWSQKIEEVVERTGGRMAEESEV